MTDVAPRDDATPSPQKSGPNNEIVLPVVGWVLTLVGWGLVALIIAYVDRNNASPRVRESYRYMIRTFWIGVLYALLPIAAILLAIGFLQERMVAPLLAVFYLYIAALALWHLARCIKGIVLLVREQPIGSPSTWLV